MGILDLIKKVFTQPDANFKRVVSPDKPRDTEKDSFVGDKLPKEIIHRPPCLDEKLNIDDLVTKDFNPAKSIPVFLNWCRKGMPVSTDTSYPVYFYYDYGIQNTFLFHSYLVQEGYFRKSTPKESLSSLKVIDLKNILEKNNLVSNGKKSVLIDRILSEIPIDNLDVVEFNEHIYQLSPKGLEAIKHNDIIIQIHRHPKWGLTDNELRSYLKSLKNDSEQNFYDFAWFAFNKRLISFSKEGNWGLYANTRYNMADLLLKEKCYKEAYYEWLLLLYLELSGLHNNIILSYNDIYVPPSLIKHIQEFRDYYSPDLFARCCSIKLPFSYIDKAIFEIVIEDIFSGKEFSLENYKDQCKKKPRKFYDLNQITQ